MFIAGFPAGPVGTNCYLVAIKQGEECLVVDPGVGAVPGVEALVREHRLKPVAVLMTHGHFDHVWSVTPLQGAYEAVAYIHADDRHRLADPTAGWPPGRAEQMLGEHLRWAEPDDVRVLRDGEALTLAGLDLTVAHTPGHSEGSVMFRAPWDGGDDVDSVLFSGDTLFKGSIGRTDLPGGDPEAMRESLLAKVLTLPDEVAVLPGHGEQTSIGHERATNPFLRRLA